MSASRMWGPCLMGGTCVMGGPGPLPNKRASSAGNGWEARRPECVLGYVCAPYPMSYQECMTDLMQTASDRFLAFACCTSPCRYWPQEFADKQVRRYTAATGGVA